MPKQFEFSSEEQQTWIGTFFVTAETEEEALGKLVNGKFDYLPDYVYSHTNSANAPVLEGVYDLDEEEEEEEEIVPSN